MLAAIGETFDPALSEAAKQAASLPPDAPKPTPSKSIITGVIVSARPSFYRLSIWTRLAPSSNPSADSVPPNTHPSEVGDALRQRIEAIGKHFKTSVLGYAEGQRLGGQLSTEVEFVSHKDSEKKPKGAKKWII